MTWSTFPTDLADRCVKCAQCLPVCPTWRITRDETESPRGRIAIMIAAADGSMAPDGESLRHLDQCIGCGQCERACPAEVPFRALMDAAQHATHGGGRAPWRARMLRRATAFPRVFRSVIAPLLRLATFTPFRDPLMPARAARSPRPGTYAPTASPNGMSVDLFLGCVARALDGATLSGALEALRNAGYEVRVPRDQACCGALHRHAGDADAARRLDARNARAFDRDVPIASCASGCAATQRDQPALGARVVDVSVLVARAGGTRDARPGTVVHVPCTLFTAGEEASSAALLAGARRLPARGRCCGAGGEYLLRQPDLARRLRDEVLDGIGDAPVVCTSNPGCAMHLREGLAARGRTTVVRHPVLEWLDAGPTDHRP